MLFNLNWTLVFMSSTRLHLIRKRKNWNELYDRRYSWCSFFQKNSVKKIFWFSCHQKICIHCFFIELQRINKIVCPKQNRCYIQLLILDWRSQTQIVISKSRFWFLCWNCTFVGKYANNLAIFFHNIDCCISRLKITFMKI